MPRSSSQQSYPGKTLPAAAAAGSGAGSRAPSELLVVALYSLFAAVLGSALFRGGSDQLLYLLVAPTLLVSLFYSRRVYLTLCLISALMAVTVVLIRYAEPAEGLYVTAAVNLGVAVLCELLHCPMQVRLRTETDSGGRRRCCGPWWTRRPWRSWPPLRTGR